MYALDKSNDVPRPKVTPKSVAAFDVKNCKDAIIKYLAVAEVDVIVR